MDNFIHVSLNRKAASITQHLLPRALTATIYEAYQADIYWSLEDFRREVARWRTRWVITKCNDLPTTLCTTLDSVNQVLYPSIDTILIKLCVLSTMPVASATVERSFSVQRCLKNYVRSIMKNDRLSSHGLVHIHRDLWSGLVQSNWGVRILRNSCLSKSSYPEIESTFLINIHHI